MAARGGKGAEGDEGRSLHEGSVSMVTPPHHHPSQRTSKSSPPSTNVRLSRHARGGGGAGGGRASGAGSRRRDLIGFLDNSWYQKQVRSSHRLAARETKNRSRATAD